MKALVILLLTKTLLINTPVEINEWYYYDLDGSKIYLSLCDSLVTVHFNEAYADGAPLNLPAMVTGLRQDYEPQQRELGYWQYGVKPNSDIADLLSELRALEQVDFATPAFQLTGNDIWNCYHELLVAFAEGVSETQIDSVLSRFALEIRQKAWAWRASFTLVQTEDSPPDIFAICNQLFQSGLCKTAYPNLYGSPRPCFLPDDTYFHRQWHLHHNGTFIGKPDADIDMREAWDYASGNTYIDIAVIDLAFDLDHDDLDPAASHLALDAGSQRVDARMPDFRPGMPDEPYRSDPDLWHGTACLGIISASVNNRLGVAGVARDLCYTPIKVVDDRKRASFESFTLAFHWPTYFMVDVIFCAVEPPVAIPDVRRAVETAYNHGTPIIIPAGNNGGRLSYLASLPQTLAVGGTDYYDNVWAGSNRGRGLDIVAPAVGITTIDVTGDAGYNHFNADSDSCNLGPDYYCNFGGYSGPFTGTSAAAAQVAAVAGLLKSRRPELTGTAGSAEPLYDVLRYSADQEIHPSDPPGYDTIFGYGRLNAERALLAVVRGDANNDGVFNVADAVYIIEYIFNEGPSPKPRLLTGDADGNGILNLCDATYLIGYALGDGPPPVISFIYDD